MSLLNPFKSKPPIEPIEEDPLEFDNQEEILQPEAILKHEDNLIQSGKALCGYLIRFNNYLNEDAN